MPASASELLKRFSQPAQKIAGRVRKGRPRSSRKAGLGNPVTLNQSPEDSPGQLQIDVGLGLERHTRFAVQLRQDELQRFVPTNVKPHRSGMNPSEAGLPSFSPAAELAETDLVNFFDDPA